MISNNSKKKGFVFTFLFLSFNLLYSQIKVLNGGRVGIGTTDVSESKLHVSGDQYVMPLQLSTSTGMWGYCGRAICVDQYVKHWVIQLNGGSHAGENFMVYAQGRVLAKNFTQLSDSRLKTNIDSINDAITKLMSLRGVYYNYIPGSSMDTSLKVYFNDSLRQIGVIAQEVKNVLPEVVDSTENGLLTVQYTGFIPLLIEGIKIHQTKIVSLENKITEINSNIESLQSIINAQQVQLTTQQTYIENLQSQISNLEDLINNCCGTNGGDLFKQKNDIENSNPKNNSIKDLNKSNQNISNNLIVKQSKLFQNIPNPYTLTTEIKFETPINSNVSILVFDLQGKLVKSFTGLKSGVNSINLDGSELKSGMYVYSLIVNGIEIDTKRMILTD